MKFLPTNTTIQQLVFGRFKKRLLNWLALFGLILLLVVYTSGFIQQLQLTTFSRDYADCIFLGFILVSIAQRLYNPNSIVDPIYWLLLGAAFSAWFGLTLMRISIWPDLAASTRGLVSDVSYFLFYSLTIAAIEVKSYQTSRQLLDRLSILIWVATLSFTVGAFILLVLTADKAVNTEIQFFPSSFIFYILMDIYLVLRWWHHAWECRKNLWLSYFLLGFAALNWLVADIVEGLGIINKLNLTAGTWFDWLWYTPYIIVFIAIQLKITHSREQQGEQDRQVFLRTHLLNSPLFFVMVSFALGYILDNQQQLFAPLNEQQQSVLTLWITLSIALSILQFLLLLRKLRSSNRKVIESKISTQVLQQRMLQQAQKLESQHASNKAILETTHNAIFTLNSSGKILSCNPAACLLLGYSNQELLNSDFAEVVQAKGELARFFSYQSYRQKLISQHQGIEIESTVTSFSGQPLPVHVTLSQDKNDSAGFVVVSMVNISEQKQAQSEILKLKDQFTANISHEFRTPLTIINGVLDNLLSQGKYQESKEQLETAKRNSLRMIRMVEQLLELSRVANEPMPIAPLNLFPLANFVCLSFEEIAKHNQIEFSYQLQPSVWVSGNSQAMEKILFNLLSNAFKYTKQGSVKVSLQQITDAKVQLVVSDTGIGIEEKQKSEIFERFHRVDNTTTQLVHGVGIGLSLVKELCDAMHCKIELESRPDEGSQFKILIPGAKAQVEPLSPNNLLTSNLGLAKSIESETVDAKLSPDKQGQQKSEHSVLIVEDNFDMQLHIQQVLSPYHHCLTADNGEEGLRLATDYIPDIIVSDVMMPGISGFELLKNLKKMELTNHIPIILLTARGDSASKLRGLEAEADDYLSKPFDARELVLRVNNQLKSRKKLQHKLSSLWQRSAKPVEPAPVVEDKFVQKLEQIFTDNYNITEFSMLDLASELAMSDRQVQRKVKAMFGVSPLEALKKFRLKQAKKLLEGGEQIGVVAQSCGFSSQSYFGRCFKEEFGLPPKTFQQTHQ